METIDGTGPHVPRSAGRRLRDVGAAFAFAGLIMVIAACAGSDASSSPPVSAEDTTSSTAATSTGPQSDSSEPSAPEPDLADLEVLWGQLWVASGLVPEERAAAIAELGDAIHPIVAEGVPTMLIETTERKVSTFPVFETTADGTVEIRDCIIYGPMIFESITHVHSGTAIPDDDGGWIIDSVTRETRGCVPATLQTEILDDYAEFWDARIEYTNPMDPDHPGVEGTMTGEQLTTIRERLLEAQVQGQYVVQGIVSFHPEISNIYSFGLAEVVDCIELSTETGFFERNGERVGAGEPITAGQRDLYTVSMRSEGGQWKVESIEIETAEACDFAPTPAGLKVIG